MTSLLPSSELPAVCICVPAYNAEKTIRETLVSLLAQTYANLKILVVDNASTDGTVSIVEALSDARIQLHRNAENLGGEGNFNRCIQLADGKYTAIFHADDIYEPEMVAQQVAFLEAHPSAGAVFTEASLIDASGKVFGGIQFPSTLRAAGALLDFTTLFKAVLKHSNFLVCPSVMVRTTVYQQEIKSWRGELYKSSADLDVWLRIAQHHKVGLLPAALMRYRISADQFSAKVRLQVERPDFFLVMDSYLANTPVSQLLDEQDLDNYAKLDRRDKVMRAVNAVVAGQASMAKPLLTGVFSWAALKAALQTKKGLAVLLAALYLKLLLALRQERLAQLSLGYCKRVLKR
ncbi:glycosyltransferase family 2 protein [Leeia sp.]|uniref:glycosyltransferase family 2 protein n=1 Tax=Leeia sp. TaxID=2884678 RepID=UPI0035B431A5